jgi:uncharacterized protein with von Willebrand factor type A (vWA) domain
MTATAAPIEPSAARRIVGFVRLLRDNGFPVGLPESRDALRAAGAIDLSRPAELRWALKALLTASPSDWRRFDELWDLHWAGRGRRTALKAAGAAPGGRADRRPGPMDRRIPMEGADGTEAGEGEGAGEGGRRGGASATEKLTSTDLRHIADPEALARVDALAIRLARRMRDRLVRRERRVRRGRRLDLRGTIHRSVATDGMPFRPAFRRRRTEPVRLVVLLDVSGSMSLYSGFFLRFVRALIDRFHRADAFVFHTRLVHVGPALRERDISRALDRMSLMAAGWSGGTRIGESVAAFNDHHAGTAGRSRTIAVIVSDGYDTGPPEVLAAELARLRRRVRRVVWLNPMLGWQGYEPVARGMAAALPHIDLFLPAHNLESLAALEPVLARV